MKFEEFLELSKNEMNEYLTRFKLNWWERIEMILINKWWASIRNTNFDLKAIVLWESIYKGRF